MCALLKLAVYAKASFFIYLISMNIWRHQTDQWKHNVSLWILRRRWHLKKKKNLKRKHLYFYKLSTTLCICLSIQMSAVRCVSCQKTESIRIPRSEEEPSGICKQETVRTTYSFHLVQTGSIEQTRSLWDSLCLPSPSPRRASPSFTLIPPLCLSERQAGETARSGQEQEEGAVTLFSSPVKSQMGAYLNVY